MIYVIIAAGIAFVALPDSILFQVLMAAIIVASIGLMFIGEALYAIVYEKVTGKEYVQKRTPE